MLPLKLGADDRPCIPRHTEHLFTRSVLTDEIAFGSPQPDDSALVFSPENRPPERQEWHGGLPPTRDEHASPARPYRE
jgi:hypothetical protein